MDIAIKPATAAITAKLFDLTPDNTDVYIKYPIPIINDIITVDTFPETGWLFLLFMKPSLIDIPATMRDIANTRCLLYDFMNSRPFVIVGIVCFAVSISAIL
jgi:hypothetical protein